MTQLATASKTDQLAPVDERQFVTLRVAGQLFGISVMDVRDVLRPMKVTPVPLAPREIVGSMNLRGRIVTVLDLRARLGLPPQHENAARMYVVVEYDKELYSLVVDSVGDVMSLPASQLDKNPPNLDPQWREVCSGVFRLQKELLLIMNIQGALRM
jgi:purine-binding chemotaxis protein CheW